MKGEPGLRDRKKRLTRAALCRAAVTLAAERGLDQVTVEDISAAADVSPRTFFNYFSSKEEAVVGPDPEAGLRLRDRVVGAPAGVSAVGAVKGALVAEVVENLADDRELWMLRMKVVQQHPVLLARAFAGGEDVERRLAEGVAARVGQVPDEVFPLLLAAAAGAAFRVAITRWSTVDDPLESLLGEALDLLAAGLADPPRS
ncbi:TetR/AcrR family transcriptional regulator [Saccharothrix variisporea]|uniref:TetR family transcriptional regulator n=1 Tax=Saccharothrix variisporea TaxID=543527 RepID=A0A495XJB2_9PSEU|nr:TetR/AcrR family transcriptional regulator [Saccharothrix variisporea]RKT74177.1 TetR family transcriptional regulator [Saccharothrix variisporea]